jgi:hypothetical protein
MCAMRILVEVTEESNVQPVDGDTAYEKNKYWLLHFGLDYRIIEAEEGRLVAVNFTVAVCQNYETGQIELFKPDQLRIIGKQIKE